MRILRNPAIPRVGTATALLDGTYQEVQSLPLLPWPSRHVTSPSRSLDQHPYGGCRAQTHAPRLHLRPSAGQRRRLSSPTTPPPYPLHRLPPRTGPFRAFTPNFVSISPVSTSCPHPPPTSPFVGFKDTFSNPMCLFQLIPYLRTRPTPTSLNIHTWTS